MPAGEQRRTDRATEVTERREPHLRWPSVSEQVRLHGGVDALDGRLAEPAAGQLDKAGGRLPLGEIKARLQGFFAASYGCGRLYT